MGKSKLKWCRSARRDLRVPLGLQARRDLGVQVDPLGRQGPQAQPGLKGQLDQPANKAHQGRQLSPQAAKASSATILPAGFFCRT